MIRTKDFLSALLALSPVCVVAQTPVNRADFVVVGVSSQTDSAGVRKLLGTPDSVTSNEHPYDVGGKLIDWWYRRLRISYNGGEKVGGVWLLAPGAKTARGLQVGDARRRAQELYGIPASVDSESDAWVYHDGRSEMHLIKVFFRSDRVDTVFLGWVLD